MRKRGGRGYAGVRKSKGAGCGRGGEPWYRFEELSEKYHSKTAVRNSCTRNLNVDEQSIPSPKFTSKKEEEGKKSKRTKRALEGMCLIGYVLS